MQTAKFNKICNHTTRGVSFVYLNKGNTSTIHTLIKRHYYRYVQTLRFHRLCLWTGVVVNRKFNKTIHVLLFAVKLHFLLSMCQWMYFAFSSSDIFMVIRKIPSVQRWIFEIFAFLKLKNWNAFVAFECFWAI